MKDQIEVVEGFCPTESCAQILRELFDRRKLWEDRSLSGRPVYRNGQWFTLGASVYMDLATGEGPEEHRREVFHAKLPAFGQKTQYFNYLLRSVFPGFYVDFLTQIQSRLPGSEVKYLCDEFALAPMPGFHIFPPEETLQAPFGKVHEDIQWQDLWKLPKMPFILNKGVTHFTFTLPLVMPYQGGGMLIPKSTEAKMPTEFFFYEEGNLYIHSGQFPHQVLPLRGPVTPLDWRITFQGHGFTIPETNKTYLYW